MTTDMTPTNDPFERAKQIRRGELDDEMPGYEELTGWLQRVPMTWLPGLLADVVQLCALRKVFQDGRFRTVLALKKRRAITFGRTHKTPDSEKSMVPPLRQKTLTLDELQLRTLNVIRLVRFQLGRAAHENGMSDDEFIEQVLEPLETIIYQDRQILKMAKKQKAGPESSKSG